MRVRYRPHRPTTHFKRPTHTQRSNSSLFLRERRRIRSLTGTPAPHDQHQAYNCASDSFRSEVRYQNADDSESSGSVQKAAAGPARGHHTPAHSARRGTGAYSFRRSPPRSCCPDTAQGSIARRSFPGSAHGNGRSARADRKRRLRRVHQLRKRNRNQASRRISLYPLLPGLQKHCKTRIETA